MNTLSRHFPAVLLLLPLLASAASPSSGTLTDASGPLNYTPGPFTTANPSPVPEVDVGPRCSNPSEPCDDYALTISLPAGYTAAHPYVSIRVTDSWTDLGSGKSEYDLYIYQGAVTTTDGTQAAYAQANSGANPSIATFSGLKDGSTTWTVKIVPNVLGGNNNNVKIELLPGPASTSGSFGGPSVTVPGQSRFQNFYAPDGTSAQAGSGEFNIGFNPATRRIMTMNFGPIWRLTPPEVVDPSNPDSCEAKWEDKSSPVTNTGLDPILWTDQKTGRTFAINNTSGSIAGVYSDNDGDTWLTPAGLPNGGADHETYGTGPYPSSLSALITPVNQGQYALYCSQDIVGPAMCQRSDTLGTIWGNGVPAYTGSGPQGCSGLHGHVHVAANGTAWLPVKQCNSRQGGVTSTDAGTTWNEFAVTGSHSQAQGADPSIALDANSTAYYCYVNNEPTTSSGLPEGHVHIAVSKDGGTTWIRDFDVGKALGVVNAAHTEAVGGSAGRAACGFLGTNVPGDYQAIAFTGTWYAFVAMTYDEGQTWSVVNATPNDPVQSHTGIWQQGGGEQDRNLLDFNEITLDDRGNVLYGYSDGCVTAGCIAGTQSNDFTAWMRVARQSGGKSLLQQFDPVEPQTPDRACLSGSRDQSASHLSWKTPDNGGADINNYAILRGTTAGGETLIGYTKGPDNSFDDTTADPAVANYYYVIQALNGSGTGQSSNEVKLVSTPPPPPQSVCSAPGKTLLTDPAGDNTVGGTGSPAPAGTDLLSLQLAQPLAADANSILLRFTINTDNGQSPQPAGSAWYVSMKIADTSATGYHYRAVHMLWSGTTPTFESYTPAPNQSGTVDGRFVTAGTQKPADASSSYASPYNKIIIVVKASDLGLRPGDVILGFNSATTQTTDATGTGAGATETYDQMPNSLAYTNSYTVGNSFDCDVIFRNGFE